jgi:ubiquinone/menaquinone biosynthesis C-methylase UbiE
MNKGIWSDDFQKSYWERAILSRRRPDHPVIAAYVLPKIELIRKTVAMTSATRLLDVGCGNGFFTYYFDKFCDAYGIDASQAMLGMNPVKKILKMDADALAFGDGSFDVVFCHDLLHHVGRADRVVCEMKRVSRKYVVLLESNRNNPFLFLFAALVPEERGCLKSSLSYLTGLAQNQGLRVLESFSYGMVFPNKLPVFMIPLSRCFNFKQPLGETNFVIAQK